jgi:Fe-S-cluster-containing dehydrogenase component
MRRRTFLKVLGVAGATAAGIDAAADTSGPGSSAEPPGLLVDTTRCAGCRNCELVCAEAHGLPEPDLDEDVFARERSPSESALSIVNRYETTAGEVFVKRQCMHCVQPACAAACLTRAMHKTPQGAVAWDVGKCMGCRFCMVSCPFDVPKFEYDSPAPRIVKCDLCIDRLREGELPACVANCPAEALAFGTRREMIEEAYRRINESPEGYVHRIYGEREAGGTTCLYLAAAPFEQLGFRTDVGSESFPSLTAGFLYSVPIVLTVIPALLLGLNRATRHDGDKEEDDGPGRPDERV